MNRRWLALLAIPLLALPGPGCTSGGVTTAYDASPTPGPSAAPGYLPARYLGPLLGHPEGSRYHESVQIDEAMDFPRFLAGLRDTSAFPIDFTRERLVVLRDVIPPIPACTGEEFAFRDDPNEIVYTTRVVGTPPPQPCAVAPLPPGEHFAAFALAKGGKPVRGVRPFAELLSPPPTTPPTPVPSVSHCPPTVGDRTAIATGSVYDPRGERILAPVAIEIVSLDPGVPYRARVNTEFGAWVVNNVPTGLRVAVTARLACGQRVTRTVDPERVPGFTPDPCTTRPGRYDLNFGGPASLRDADAPLFALEIQPGPLPSGSPSPCPDASASP